MSTASCDPALGYVVPPSEYQLIALIPHHNGPVLTSEPVLVTVGS